MRTVDDAWAWYQAVVSGADRLAHLAKYWDDLPWGGPDRWVARLERDNVLRYLGAADLADGSAVIRAGLDDLAILVLFSVFEAAVRDVVASDLRPEVGRLEHPALRAAGAELLGTVAEGSFFRVLEPLKAPATVDLVEQVNQVRRYRNWVAHGRRPDLKPAAEVTPAEAYRRLQAFMAAVRPPAPPPAAPGAAR